MVNSSDRTLANRGLAKMICFALNALIAFETGCGVPEEGGKPGSNDGTERLESSLSVTFGSLGTPPGITINGIAVASWQPARFDVFATGSDDALWHKWYDGSWHSWESLGGNLGSGPAAVSWGRGRIDIVAKDRSTGFVDHLWYDNGWGTWESLGTQPVFSAPGIASWQPGRLDIFARDPQGHAEQIFYDSTAGGWHPNWVSLGGTTGTSALSAVSWGVGRLDVFGTSAAGKLEHHWTDSGAPGWHDDTTLGDSINAFPPYQTVACASRSVGSLDVFFTGANTHLFHRRYDAGWTAAVDTSAVLHKLAAVSWGPARADVFGYDGVNALRHGRYLVSDTNTSLLAYFNGTKLFAANQTADGQPGAVGGVQGGNYGFIAERLDAPGEAANVASTFIYDPASSIKALPAYMTMKQVNAGVATLAGTTASYYLVPAGGSCPGTSTVTETLGLELNQMMVNSDNGATKGLMKYVGDVSAINTFAKNTLGMSSTFLSGYPGCIANQTTLADMQKVYEHISKDFTAANTTSLYNNMPADGGDSSAAKAMALQDIINTDGPVGLTTTQLAAFRRRFDVHYKEGFGALPTPSIHWSLTGLATIPACSGTTITAQTFFWGVFVSNNNSALAANARDDFRRPIEIEPLRVPIDQALAGWATCCPASTCR